MGRITEIASFLRSLLSSGRSREAATGGEDGVSAKGILSSLGLKTTPAALCEMSRGYAELGLKEKALEAVEGAAALDGSNPEVRLQRGIVRASMGRFEEALDDFRMAAGSGRTRRVALSNAGAALGKLGRFDEAQECLEKALREWPGDSAILVNLGAVLGGKGRHADARDALHEAVRRNPGLVTGWYDLACIEAAEGRRREMLDALERAFRLDASVTERVARDAEFEPYRGDEGLLRLLTAFKEGGDGGRTVT